MDFIPLNLLVLAPTLVARINKRSFELSGRPRGYLGDQTTRPVTPTRADGFAWAERLPGAHLVAKCALGGTPLKWCSEAVQNLI